MHEFYIWRPNLVSNDNVFLSVFFQEAKINIEIIPHKLQTEENLEDGLSIIDVKYVHDCDMSSNNGVGDICSLLHYLSWFWRLIRIIQWVYIQHITVVFIAMVMAVKLVVTPKDKDSISHILAQILHL